MRRNRRAVRLTGEPVVYGRGCGLRGHTADKKGMSATPEGRTSCARTAPGRSVAFMQTASAGLASTAPPPLGSGVRQNRRDVIANQIFPQYVDKFVCGRAHRALPPAGVIRKRGLRPPLVCLRRIAAPCPVKNRHIRPSCRANRPPRHRSRRPQGEPQPAVRPRGPQTFSIPLCQSGFQTFAYANFLFFIWKCITLYAIMVSQYKTKIEE